MRNKIKCILAAVIAMTIVSNNNIMECNAMNATGIKRDYAGDAYVIAQLNVNGNSTSYSASSTETSDFDINGLVYDSNNCEIVAYSSYQVSSCSFSRNWDFNPQYADATFSVSGYTGSCSICVTVN